MVDSLIVAYCIRLDADRRLKLFVYSIENIRPVMWHGPHSFWRTILTRNDTGVFEWLHSGEDELNNRIDLMPAVKIERWILSTVFDCRMHRKCNTIHDTQKCVADDDATRMEIINTYLTIIIMNESVCSHFRAAASVIRHAQHNQPPKCAERYSIFKCVSAEIAFCALLRLPVSKYYSLTQSESIHIPFSFFFFFFSCSATDRPINAFITFLLVGIPA